MLAHAASGAAGQAALASERQPVPVDRGAADGAYIAGWISACR